jgi:fructose-1,6-bisphosphatase/inositol monophosphatase family enzyme
MTIPQANEDAEALLRIAVATATEAGRLLASWRGDERPEGVQTKSSPTDIAAEVDGTVVAGVVEVPRHGERFTAVAGQGAWLHRGEARLALRCSSGVPLGQALVGTGFGYDPGRRRVQGEVLAALLPYIRDIRRGGSAAADLCSVAAGRLDAFYERGLNYWDFAAGGLIAREAGALVGGLAGRTESTSMAVAAGPGLYQQLEAFLSKLNPERDVQRSQGREA